MREANFSLLTAVLVTALLIGCGSDGDSTVVKTATEQGSQSATATVTSRSAAQAPKPVHLKQFQSPSHNIGCYLSKQRGGSVRCDIREHSWTAPPKPAFCDVDWGGGLQVGSKRRGSIVCAGDTVLDPGSPVLGYGKASELGSIACRSSEAGVRCSNTQSGHGFFVSRERYGLF